MEIPSCTTKQCFMNDERDSERFQGSLLWHTEVHILDTGNNEVYISKHFFLYELIDSH